MSKVTKTEDSKIGIDNPSTQVTELKPPSNSKNSKFTNLEMELNILFKFIKPYDGSRETINSFINNCNNAYEQASESQKPILFKYILSQLQGKAEIACSIKEFISWEQLREFLKTQFSERKHYTHLLTDLQESKQAPTENVSQYSLKIETCLSQLLTEITLSNTKAKELSGRTAAMEDLALHHFLMGLYPRISNIVRCRAPKNLNEAISLAISEERIQQKMYPKRNNPQFDQNVNNLKTQVPLFKPKAQLTQQSQYKSPQPNYNTNNISLVCRYCKNIGHDIKDCRKRQYFNNRYPTQQNQLPNSNNNKKYPRVNHVQEFIEDNEPGPSEENPGSEENLND